MKNSMLALVGLLLITSCSLKPISFGGVQDSKINSLSQKGIEAEFGLKIKNPNHFGFKIYKTDVNVSLNGIDVGKARLKKSVKIHANSDDVSTFIVSSDFSKLSLSDIPKMLGLAGGRSAGITVKGELKVGNLFYKKRFPIDISQKVPMGK